MPQCEEMTRHASAAAMRFKARVPGAVDGALPAGARGEECQRTVGSQPVGVAGLLPTIVGIEASRAWPFRQGPPADLLLAGERGGD